MRDRPVAHSFCQNCVRDAACAGTIDRHTHSVGLFLSGVRIFQKCSQLFHCVIVEDFVVADVTCPWNQVCIVKGLDTGKLIIRHTEAYRRDADGTEFIKRRAACGKCEIAGRHECSHIGNLFMQDNAAVFSCHDGKLCAVDMHGTCQDVEGNILPVVRCAETF